ncbi:hypothetical protein PISL3812_04557 [Talaromyces islandicus]|uniref:Uncharacterized protein n=1 Tax=Talaromyces islandicus TaxID=28573 RepID=A0A0U1LVX9_TALIS|nr:hypothetical protein PISL3812_04557 [Talaromyces islandicus]
MESASIVSSSSPFETKSCHHDEPLQLHSMPPWKRYESEEEEVSETSSVRPFTPTDAETESSNESSIFVENGLPSPSREDSDSTSSLYSRPLSVVTAKRNSTATHHTRYEDSEVESAREYVTPPASPTSILPYTIGEADTSTMTDDGEEAEEEEQIFEAKQVLYTAPTSKPNIIVIHNISESILPGNEETSNPTNEESKSPENIRKRSSTASGLSPPDRSKRYSAMFLRDDGELAYADHRSHVRARSAQRIGGSPYRSRAASPSVNGETRPPLLKRNTSQRSTRSVYIAPDESLRTRTFRSASLASDNTSSSSTSSKQPITQNSSTSSFHTSSTSSTEPPFPDSDKSKLTPHPLSISTTVTPAPIQFTGPFGTSPRNPGLAPHARSESLLNDVDPISPAASSTYSPMERTNSRMSMPKAQGIYSLRHNPTLSLATGPGDLEPQASRDWTLPASAKTPKAGANAMKSLMGGFRGLGRPRKRSLAPAPAPN